MSPAPAAGTDRPLERRCAGLGSRLREISGSGENRDLTAAVMVREALESLDDVQVGEVTTDQQGESLTISIRLQLAVGEYEIEVGVPYGQ